MKVLNEDTLVSIIEGITKISNNDNYLGKLHGTISNFIVFSSFHALLIFIRIVGHRFPRAKIEMGKLRYRKTTVLTEI